MFADVLVDAMATYRLTRLVQRDSITEGLRDWLRPRLPGGTVELLECPWCCAVWGAGALTVLRWCAPGVGRLVSQGLAASAGGAVLDILDRRFIEDHD